jgi:hypothetical protein
MPHAYQRFAERWEKLRGKKLKHNQISLEFAKCFARAKRYIDNSRKFNMRLKRYKFLGVTLFLKAEGFTFIVSNGIIWTVEISDKNKRYLN